MTKMTSMLVSQINSSPNRLYFFNPESNSISCGAVFQRTFASEKSSVSTLTVTGTMVSDNNLASSWDVIAAEGGQLSVSNSVVASNKNLGVSSEC